MEKTSITNTAKIDIQVHRDAENQVIEMDWDATDSPVKGRKACKSALIALWDANAKNTLRIDMWTKDMPIGEMNYFMFQSMITLADTYQNATNNKEVAEDMRQFARHFAQKSGIAKKK